MKGFDNGIGGQIEVHGAGKNDIRGSTLHAYIPNTIDALLSKSTLLSPNELPPLRATGAKQWQRVDDA
jgi:hypothetical protein